MSVASKNPFDLLGNDDDSDTPKAPVKTVDKTSTHTVKRNTDGHAPASKGPVSGGGRRGGVVSGNEAAFRDRNAGSDRNRSKPVDDSAGGRGRGGHNARVRGGRGSRYPRERDDRHSKHVPSGGSEKQAAQSWGATEGKSELNDEQAGEQIAQTEQKEDAEEAGAEGEAKDGEPAEPEEKQISYDAYLAQLAEKKLALEAENARKLRQANEGTQADKKWANAKPLVKESDEEYFAGTGGKAKRERERKTKQVLEIDQRFVEPERPRGGGRGGRGGARGDSSRGRGGPRGGASRGEFRGGRGGGGRGATEPPVNPNDQSAFPSLGS